MMTLRSVAAAGLSLLLLACSSDDGASSGNRNGTHSDAGAVGGAGGATGGPGVSGGTTGSGASSGTGATQGVGGADANQIAQQLCGSSGCACGNGIDDDNDGKIDGFDEECTGPFDDDEGSFATGIPGDNQDPKWQDCFFDGNSGAGDDGCRYHTDCLTGDLEQSDPDCQVVEECREFCGSRTPNGCDCFGCCEVSFDGATVNVFIGSDCSFENIDDEKACPRCVPTDTCSNECGECELCPGRTLEDLPESCSPEPPMGPDGGQPPGADAAVPPPQYTCDNGEELCSTSSDCVGGGYCQFGCCLPYVR